MIALTLQRSRAVRVPTLPGIGAVTVIREAGGRPCGFRFPAPYEDLVIREGAPVTPGLLRRVAAAHEYFGQRT